MNRIIRQFDKQFELLEGKRSRGWDRIYVAVDIHETMMIPTWTPTLSTEFYEHALDALRLISEDPDVCLILWSCSLKEVNEQYQKLLLGLGVNFHYINENPECKSTSYADFESKLYFSVGLDDKFGFIPEEDWFEIREYFRDRQLARNKKKIK